MSLIYPSIEQIDALGLQIGDARDRLKILRGGIAVTTGTKYSTVLSGSSAYQVPPGKSFRAIAFGGSLSNVSPGDIYLTLGYGDNNVGMNGSIPTNFARCNGDGEAANMVMPAANSNWFLVPTYGLTDIPASKYVCVEGSVATASFRLRPFVLFGIEV